MKLSLYLTYIFRFFTNTKKVYVKRRKTKRQKNVLIKKNRELEFDQYGNIGYTEASLPITYY